MAQITAPKGGRGSRRSLHIDMTPMVDLAFLLLTFFVLTMTINKKYALEIIKPDQEDDKKEPPLVKRERVLTLLLGDNDKIHYFLGDEAIKTTNYELDGIRHVLLDATSKRPDLIVLVKPMRTSRYQNLVDIIDEMDTTKLRYYLVKETAEDRAMIDP
ncbi:MAG: biopolymer transporter ExbD [Chryseolinea sp.]